MRLLNCPTKLLPDVNENVDVYIKTVFTLQKHSKNLCVLHKTWLTHWGRVTHICVGNLTTIGSDNGLVPVRRQAIIWTHARILSIGPLGTSFSEFFFIPNSYICIQENAFETVVCEMATILSPPQCVNPGINMLTNESINAVHNFLFINN